MELTVHHIDPYIDSTGLLLDLGAHLINRLRGYSYTANSLMIVLFKRANSVTDMTSFAEKI